MRKELVLGLITAAVLAAAALLSLSFGTADISIGETLGILFSADKASDAHQYIIMHVRVPRIITSLLVGMALAVSGVVFQALFRNPMAEPFILGVSSGAAFGVALGSFLGAFVLIPGIWGVPVFAFAGAVGASFVIYLLSGRMRSSTVTLLLSGVAMNFFLSSLMSLLMFFNRDHLESIVYWSMGSFSSASWDKLTVAAPLLAAGLLLIPRYVREMDLLLLGEQSAKAAGLSVKNTRIKLLILATLLTSLAVAVSGVIGFVGLIIPHIVRMILGPGHKRLIPFSLAAGGAFTLIADTLSRGLLPSSEIPVGIITSLAGAPFFIHLLTHQKKEIFS
jgi:iron complex transport system permease protein